MHYAFSYVRQYMHHLFTPYFRLNRVIYQFNVFAKTSEGLPYDLDFVKE